MKRILIVDISKNFGGADVRVQQIASNLSRSFDLKTAVLSSSQTAARFAAEKIDTLQLDRKRKDPRLFYDLKRIISAFKPSAIDTHNAQSMLWGLPAAHSAGVPIRIATVHSIFEQSEKHRFGGLIYAGLYAVMKRHATHFISVSQTVTEHLVSKGFDPEAITTIPNGVSVPPLRLQDDPPRLKLIAVGRLVPVKGFDALLLALSMITKCAPTFELEVVGDGPERARLQDLAAKLGLSKMVHFAGYQTDVAPRIAASQLFVMPSLSEGLPFAALEAGAAGVPIVASRVGGLQAYFGNENAAVMVPPGDPEALASAILKCLRDRELRRKIAAKSRTLVETRHSLARMLDETARIYNSDSAASTLSRVA